MELDKTNTNETMASLDMRQCHCTFLLTNHTKPSSPIGVPTLHVIMQTKRVRDRILYHHHFLWHSNNPLFDYNPSHKCTKLEMIHWGTMFAKVSHLCLVHNIWIDLNWVIGMPLNNICWYIKINGIESHGHNKNKFIIKPRYDHHSTLCMHAIPKLASWSFPWINGNNKVSFCDLSCMTIWHTPNFL